MITNDQELQVTQERIARLQRLLLQLRSTARPAEFQALASGYRLEIERMEAEVLDLPYSAAGGRAPPKVCA
jgi:hypothetical protein